LNEIRSMKINTEVQFVIVEEELKTLRKKDHKLKSRTSSSKSCHSEDKPERNSLRVADYYQHDPHTHHKRERKAKEVSVDLSHFHRKDDVCCNRDHDGTTI